MNKSKVKALIRYNSIYQDIRERKKVGTLKKRWDLLPKDEQPSVIRVVHLGKSATKQIVDLLEMIDIKITPGKRFQSWIDVGCILCGFDRKIGNTSPNYRLIVDKSLKQIKEEISLVDNEVARNNVAILCAVEKYIDRIISQLSQYNDINSKRSCYIFERMKTFPAESLDEALQRIIFWSSIFWQSGHRLMGLGRLDLILENVKLLSEEESINIITDFYEELNRYYAYKSNAESLGDTGQIIILGGESKFGSYMSNDLTYYFIKALINNPVPDPKLLLRVSPKMPKELLILAIECIATGVGSPLLANDATIVPRLIDFGYLEEDAYNYVVSACWEPLSYGKSLEQNNIADINFAQVFVDTYLEQSFTECSSFSQLIKLYKSNLDKHITKVLASIDAIQWSKDPLLTLFTDDCLSRNLDIADGGAHYNNYGILSVGLSNAVDSLLFIRDKVFEKKEYSLESVRDMLIKNYNGDHALANKVRDESCYFGHDDNGVIELINCLVFEVDSRVKKYRNKYNGRAKWGLSSSNYQVLGRITNATLDGRFAGEHLGVHISPNDSVAYTELFSFAKEILNGEYQSNGNTIDMFISPSVLTGDKGKFVDFIMLAIKNGLFEMQMNVVDSKTLIDAKKHPEKYKHLIVRVWGFSAYFNDLPDEYKMVLINRALASEGKKSA